MLAIPLALLSFCLLFTNSKTTSHASRVVDKDSTSPAQIIWTTVQPQHMFEGSNASFDAAAESDSCDGAWAHC
eukprot:513127-Pleurochrysis_carterae.AAC.1